MILVTGGTGFVGRHLVDALVCRGDVVRVLSRSASPAPSQAGVEIVAGDLADAASLSRAARGVRAVVHLAARVGTAEPGPAEVYDFNAGATAAIVAAARDAGVARFVHVSSGGVYGDGSTPVPHKETDTPQPGNAYERSKLAAEQAVIQTLAGSDVSWTILRPAGIFGPGRPATSAFLEEIRRRRFWLHGNPNVIVHPTHVSDVVQACLRVLDVPRLETRIVNIAGERALRFQEFVSMAAELLNVRPRQIIIPAWIGVPISRTVAFGARATGLSLPAVIERAGRPWINRALDTSLARQWLGFTPVSLRPALSETVHIMPL